MGGFCVVVLDFETTGLSPNHGDRVIEVGAVRLEDNRVVDRFQSLMNPGMRVSRFIEEYTGITNGMLAGAPPVASVMERFADFAHGHNLVAHNAGFDCRFLDAELTRIGRKRSGDFACSMIVSRRVYPEAKNHRLETLVRHKRLKTEGAFHRALADAEMTGHLWLRMIEDLKERYEFKHVEFDLMRRLQKVSKNAAPAFLKKAAAGQR